MGWCLTRQLSTSGPRARGFFTPLQLLANPTKTLPLKSFTTTAECLEPAVYLPDSTRPLSATGSQKPVEKRRMPSPDQHTDSPGSSVHRRPASCLSCKSRKLRCNRESPCSNCTSRNLPCQQPARRTRLSRPPGANSQPDAASPEILERLRRLEHLLAERQNENPTQRKPGSVLQVTEAGRLQAPQFPIAIMPQIQDLEIDAVRLEKACKVQNSLVSLSFRCVSHG